MLFNYAPKQVFAQIALFLVIVHHHGVGMAAKEFSAEGNALSEEIVNEAIRRSACPDTKSCRALLQIHREDGKRIFINMYGQLNNILANIAADVILNRGLLITKGRPITLRVYRTTKEENLGLKSIFSPTLEALKIEMNE